MTQAMPKEQISLNETCVPGTQVTLQRLLTDEEFAVKNQQAVYPKPNIAFSQIALLQELPLLTSPSEIRQLKSELAEVAKGNAILLWAGLCAETMDDKNSGAVRLYAHNLVTMIHGLSDTLAKETGLKVTRVIRGAGQFAKPRSAAVEKCGKMVFRGEVTNGLEDREVKPLRLHKAYEFSKQVLTHTKISGKPPVYASHEALSLAYETGLYHEGHAGSSPMIWIGNRTNDPEGPHVEFAAACDNVIGLKVDGDMPSEKLEALIQKLNPDKEPGKLVLIFRVGAKHVDQKLGALLDVIQPHGEGVIAICDPMHGNTETDPLTRKKTRRMENIRDEALSFNRQCLERGIHPGGFNLEVSPNDVTECLGETVKDLTQRYETPVDPCMNPDQAAKELLIPVGRAFKQALIPA